MARNGEAAGPVLFAIGGDELGGAFVLFDFARRQSVFIAQPVSALPADQKLGFSLRLIDALTLRSHVFSTLKHPVTMTNRLLWLTTHSGAALLPRGIAVTNGAAPRSPAAREWIASSGNSSWTSSSVPNAIAAACARSSTAMPSLSRWCRPCRKRASAVEIRLYIFDSDDYALRIADLLKQRSREIRVRVLLDDLGSMGAGHVPSESPYYSGRKPTRFRLPTTCGRNPQSKCASWTIRC